MAAVAPGLAAALQDRYRLDRELGQGGMATVYLAHDLKHDRDVALKVLRPELAAVLGRERFLAEIHLTAKLDHPHILTLIDSGESGGFLWYVVPFIRGESLRQKLEREKQLGVEEALTITKQVAGALDYAHRQGVIHRDIKPENILLHEGEAMLADFGIALAAREAAGNRLTETGLSLGTPQYMSPEQATGDRHLDARSDVYSLAAVLYEMLTGEPPHTGATVQAVIAKLMTERPTRLRVVRDTVPEGIDAAVARALAKVPADRFGSPAEFAAALDSGPPSTQPSRWLGRPAVLLGGLAIVAIIGVGVWRRTRAPPEAGPTSIATFPFRVTNPALAEYREGLVDLFASALDGAGGLRAIGARTSLKRWHAEVGKEGEGDDAAVDRVAGSLGARYALTGEVIPLGAGIKLRVHVHDLARDSTYTTEADGAPDSIAGLAQRAGTELLRHIAGPAARLVTGGPFATRSFEALKAYLAGEKAFREARYRDAIAAFDRAIAADSTFALAQFRRGAAEGWTRSPHEPGAVPDEVLNALPRLGRRDSLMVRGSWELGQDYAAALTSFETLTREYPDDPEGWYLLGDAYYHVGAVQGIPTERVDSAFHRAIALDSTFAPAYLHLIEDAFLRSDAREARLLVQALARFDSTSPKTAGMQVALGLAFGSPTERDQARQRLTRLSGDALLPAKHALNLNPDLGEYTQLVARTMFSNPAFAYEYRSQATHGFAMVEQMRGHSREGWRIWTVAFRLGDSASPAVSPVPGSIQWPINLARFTLVGFPTSEDAWADIDVSILREAHPYSFGLTGLARHRWADVEEGTMRLAKLGDTLTGGVDVAGRLALLNDRPKMYALAAQLRAWGDWLKAPSPQSLARFEAATDSLRRWTSLVEYADYALGIGFLAEGDLDRAERHLHLLERWSIHVMVVPREYYLGRIAEERGNRAEAREHYARFVRWWGDCDPELKPMWEDGRQRLAKVSGEPVAP